MNRARSRRRDGPAILVEGGGGGRWFNFFNCDAMAGADYRHLLVTQMAHQYSRNHYSDPTTWSMLSDVWEGGEVAAPGNEYFTLYRRR